MNEIEEKVEALVGPELEAAGVELVDLTYQKEQAGWTLCLYLDKPGGITLDDCETTSSFAEGSTYSPTTSISLVFDSSNRGERSTSNSSLASRSVCLP